MPAKGARRDKPALLVLDMINTFDFEGGDSLCRGAELAAHRIRSLRSRFHRRGAPVIFVNDNFLNWRDDFPQRVKACASKSEGGARIAHMLRPGEQDYYAL